MRLIATFRHLASASHYELVCQIFSENGVEIKERTGSRKQIIVEGERQWQVIFDSTIPTPYQKGVESVEMEKMSDGAGRACKIMLEKHNIGYLLYIWDE